MSHCSNAKAAADTRKHHSHREREKVYNALTFRSAALSGAHSWVSAVEVVQHVVRYRQYSSEPSPCEFVEFAQRAQQSRPPVVSVKRLGFISRLEPQRPLNPDLAFGTVRKVQGRRVRGDVCVNLLLVPRIKVQCCHLRGEPVGEASR